MTDHLKVRESDHGLVSMPVIGSEFEKACVAESPNLDHPALWLRVEDYTAGQQSMATIELDADRAWQLAEQIMTMVANHFHGDARPAKRVADLLEEP